MWPYGQYQRSDHRQTASAAVRQIPDQIQLQQQQLPRISVIAATFLHERVALADTVHLVSRDCRRFGRNGRDRADRKRGVPRVRSERRELRRSTQRHGEFGVSASDWTGTESLEWQRRCGEPDWRMAAEWHSDGE